MAVITATTNNTPNYTLGIDIGSTTVKIAILDESHQILFADYERHFANIQETLASLLSKAIDKLGEMTVHPVITGSGGLALAKSSGSSFCTGSNCSFFLVAGTMHQKQM